MMTWIAETLRRYPEIAIYLALALGFFVGAIKIGKFSLGSVTGVLLMGVLIGQLEITISPHVKSVFFLMFLFAVGYGVGPQFFRGLRSDGLPQVMFAVGALRGGPALHLRGRQARRATTWARPRASSPARPRSRRCSASPPTRSATSACPRTR